MAFQMTCEETNVTSTVAIPSNVSVRHVACGLRQS